MEEARAFWGDPAEAAKWRLDIPGARRLSVSRALARLDRADEDLAHRIADAFTELRRSEYRLYPDALATVDALRAAGVKLALITNGAGKTQREKIARFDLEHRFDHIQIEGEFGHGKPELAVYRHALERLAVEPGEAWMVGDNYEWEVVAPRALGMCGIWYNPFDVEIPPHATRPTRVIRRLAELLE
jgi:putative hydrolase of the HAD superfamily